MKLNYRKMIIPCVLVLGAIAITITILQDFKQNVKEEFKTTVNSKINNVLKQNEFEDTFKIFESMDDNFYHIDSKCKNLKDRPTEMTLFHAKMEHLKPCPKCLPNGEPKRN